MAESRRVQLTTLSWDAAPFPVQAAADVPPVGQDCPPDTVRLVLALFEPDDRHFPEFSYSQLVEKKINHSKDNGPLKTFEKEEERENAEVAAIARKLEEKYGDKQKKKKDRIQDLIDIGYGYDEEDSFIDNTEAYDEFVPSSLTTKFGGFYVNSGVLQFRQASDSEAEANATEEKAFEPSMKCKIDSGQNKPKKKRYREGEETKDTLHSKSSDLSETGVRRKKKKNSVGILSVTSMLKKFQREKEKEQEKKGTATPKTSAFTGVPTFPQCPTADAAGGGLGPSDPLLSLIGSTNDHALIQAASSVDLYIDLVSLLDASEETLSPKLDPPSATEMQLYQAKADNHTQLNVAQLPNTHFLPKIPPQQIQLITEASSTPLHVCVPLPDGLTPELEESVRNFKEAVKTSEGESKLKFFTPEINSILLNIELQCREHGGQLRSKLYTHLSSFLPCSRDTLLKRVKKLLLTHMEEPPDVEDSIQKLKQAIGKAMPEQIVCHRANCQAYEQVKASKSIEEGNEDKQEDKVEERGVKRGGPKKVFEWNEEIRECLCHMLRPKIERYEKENTGSQEVEEYLKTLLDNEVKPLWPKGWMQSRSLLRESRKILGFFNSVSVRKARLDRKPPSMTCGSTMSEEGAPPEKGELPPETDAVKEGPKILNSISLDAVRTEDAPLKKMELKNGGAGDTGSSTPAGSDQPQVSVPSAPAHSLLDLLADEALPREQHFPVSQEVLAAAIAKYKHSGQHWNVLVDTKSPPPPPQSSPVGFPVSTACQGALPQALQPGDFAMNLDPGQVRGISDDSGITIQ